MAGNIRESIVAAGAEAFAEYGYDKTTVEDIAHLAHKAKTSVYYYFKGKSEIFDAVIRDEFDRIRHLLEAYRKMPEKGNPDHLRNYLKKRMEVLTDSVLLRKFAPMQYSDSCGEPGKSVFSARGEFDSWETEFFNSVCSYGLREGILNPAVRPDTFADMLEMLLKGVEVQFLVSRDREASRATFNEMVNFLIRCNG